MATEREHWMRECKEAEAEVTQLKADLAKANQFIFDMGASSVELEKAGDKRETILKADLASAKAILKMIDFPCYTCKKRARADELYLCYGCKHYFCEKCAPIHFDGMEDAEKQIVELKADLAKAWATNKAKLNQDLVKECDDYERFWKEASHGKRQAEKREAKLRVVLEMWLAIDVDVLKGALPPGQWSDAVAETRAALEGK